MSERAAQLKTTADRQIGRLIELLSAADPNSLRRPCPGRDKLGDGTTGALAAHVSDSYQQIGAFAARDSGGHRAPRRQPANPHDHAGRYAADTASPAALIKSLSASRKQLAPIALLSDRQLDAVPPNGSFRFADGQRTLEQVLTGLLRHQGRQLDALAAALS